jgi:hypothetical protein
MRFMPLLCLLALAGCGATPTKPDVALSIAADDVYDAQAPRLNIAATIQGEVVQFRLTAIGKGKFAPTLPGGWTFVVYISAREKLASGPDIAVEYDHIVGASPWYWRNYNNAAGLRTMGTEGGSQSLARIPVKVSKVGGLSVVAFDIPIAAMNDDGHLQYHLEALAVITDKNGELAGYHTRYYRGRSSEAVGVSP